MVKYESRQTKGSLTKKKKKKKKKSAWDLSNDVDAMFLCFLFPDFSLLKQMLWVPVYSNGYPQHMPLCLYKEHYENTPIQIYRKVYLQKHKIFR